MTSNITGNTVGKLSIIAGYVILASTFAVFGTITMLPIDSQIVNAVFVAICLLMAAISLAIIDQPNAPSKLQTMSSACRKHLRKPFQQFCGHPTEQWNSRTPSILLVGYSAFFLTYAVIADVSYHDPLSLLYLAGNALLLIGLICSACSIIVKTKSGRLTA